MTLDAQIDSKIGEIIGRAVTLPVPDALKVYRRLREASEELLQFIASGHMAAVEAPTAKPEVVVPIRPGAQIQYVPVRTAAGMLGMSVTSLYARLEEAPYKSMLFNNGTNKRLFLLDALEAFIRHRPG